MAVQDHTKPVRYSELPVNLRAQNFAQLFLAKWSKQSFLLLNGQAPYFQERKSRAKVFGRAKVAKQNFTHSYKDNYSSNYFWLQS